MIKISLKDIQDGDVIVCDQCGVLLYIPLARKIEAEQTWTQNSGVVAIICPACEYEIPVEGGSRE